MATTLEREVKTARGSIPLPFQIATHPLESNIIVINVPGAYGDIDGFNNKYETLANFIREKEIGAVVRTNGNQQFHGIDYEHTLCEHVRGVIEFALEESKYICGAPDPKIYLMGFSAGAGGIAAVAHEYDAVKRLLLLAPAGDAGENAITQGLAGFKGKLNIVLGEQDEVVGPEAGKYFYDLATRASERKLVMIPDCDHQFRGERNGYIMSKAPLWAFADDDTFPSPEGGKKLY